MNRQILCVAIAVLMAWLPGCRRNAPANSDNKNRTEVHPRVEASLYPYKPSTISDTIITLRISVREETAEVTQLEGRMIRIEKGPLQIWRRGDLEERAIGLVCSVIGPTRVRISLLSINGSLDEAMLFHEKTEPVGSFDLTEGSPGSVGKSPTLDVDLIRIAKLDEITVDELHRCCIACGGVTVCAITVSLDCGSCKLEDQGQNEPSK